MKYILVTGIAGFIGRHIALEYKEKGYTVIGIGRGNLNLEEQNIFGIDRWYKSDITEEDLAELLKNYKFESIIHCAGGSSVGKSVENPKKDFQDTVSSTMELLEYVRKYQFQARVVYLSSAAVYGNSEIMPLREDLQLSPISPYGLNKKMAEEICCYYADNYGISLNITRIFSVYGKGLKKQLLWDACEKFRQGIYEFYGTGEEIRDWLHVRELAKAVVFITEQQISERIINVASGKPIVIKDILCILFKNLGGNKSIMFSHTEHVGNPQKYLADIGILKKHGWSDNTNIEDGVTEYANWYKEAIH